MNILVCIKQVPASGKAEVDPITGVLKRSSTDCKMNPYDLYALETALRIRELLGGSVSVITMGPGQAVQIIKEAYSMGADAGILLTDRKFAGADVLATAYALSQGIRRTGPYDLIICGKQTTDGDTAQVGPEISEYLGIPCIANVTEIIDINQADATVKMDLPESYQVARIVFPCLICVDKDIYQPRLPSYLKKKATQGREITTITFSDLDDKDEHHYGLLGSPTQVRRIFPPEVKSDRELWVGGNAELAGRIADKLSEIKFI